MTSSPDHEATVTRADGSRADEAHVAPGSQIGRYLVIRELGRGGMGVVLRAYDPKLQREVALKCLRTHAPDPEAQSALVHEARTMAQLSHPNVVAVYDVEEIDDSVVLAMECVDGTTLVEWLAHPRPWTEVIDMLVGAGRGLAAAHAVGVLHRDFKPANVLIGRDDRPKVSDFGLAGMDGARSSREEIDVEDIVRSGVLSAAFVSRGDLGATHSRGRHVQGTPAYMAPEQHRGIALDAAADQYAFCVTAWQALTGSLPFMTRGKSLHGVARDKANGPPPWPPTAEVPRVIVDAIVRGLQPDPAARWPKLDELLAVLSTDPHRRRRIATRWAVAIGAAGLSVAATSAWLRHQDRICAGAEDQLAGIWDADRRADAERALLATGISYAPQAWSHVATTLDAYREGWIGAHVDACEATHVRGEQSEAVLDLRMDCLRRAKLQLQATTSALVAADRATVDHVHRLTEGLPQLALCDDIAALQGDASLPLDDDERARMRAIEAVIASARAQIEIGGFASARAELAEVAEDAATIDHAPTRAAWSLFAGNADMGLGNYALAETELRTALQQALAARQPRLAAWAARQLTFDVGFRQRRAEEGMALAQTALGLAEGVSPIEKATMLSTLAAVQNVGGDIVAAEQQLRESLAIHDAIDPDSVATANVRDNLAVALLVQGRFDESERAMRAAMAIYERELGTGHPDLIVSRNNLAALLHAQGRYAEAEVEVRDLLAISEIEQGPDHPDVATRHSNLAITLIELGRHAEAQAEAGRAIEIFARALGPDSRELAKAYEVLASAQAGAGQRREAEASRRRAIAIVTRAYGSEDGELEVILGELGVALVEEGRFAEAIDPLETAMRIQDRNGGEGEVPRGRLAFALARALAADRSQLARARELARAALDALEPGEDRDQVEAWLASHR